MLLVLFSLALILASLHGIQVDFERVELISGFDFYNSSLRVRKYNRTIATLNGTAQIMQTLNRSLMVSTDFFHSSRGNQQFNHYPVKLPTQNACDFVANFHTDYSEFVEDIINLPQKGECPIAPRTIYVTNKVFPTKAIPPFFPPGMQVDFERIDLISGFDFYNSSLRVRKYNRTMVTLNGTVQLLQPLNRSLMVSTDFFHSSRGNQQFNHYPVKLPTKDICDFMESFHTDYSEYMEDMINMPEKGECPIAPRTVYITNKAFPTKAVPPFFPPGLWKVYLITSRNSVEVVRYEIIAKVTNDLLS